MRIYKRTLGSSIPLECGQLCALQRGLKKILKPSIVLRMDERRTHICPKPGCGRGFTKKNNLTVHIQRVHGEKRFVCGAVDPRKLNKVGHWDGAGACGTSFTSKSNLKDHIRIAHLGLQRSQKRKCTTKEDDIPIAMASSMLKSNLYSVLEPTQTIRARKCLQVLALMVLPITLP